jgi:Tannase and feruloyl esterase
MNRRRLGFRVLARDVALGLVAVGSSAASAAQSPAVAAVEAPPEQCEALARADWGQLPDGPAQILSAQVVASASGAPAFCDVKGYSHRAIRFRVRMPLGGWNGKMVVAGTGGMAGSFAPDELVLPGGAARALSRGYALVEHDGGHVSGPGDAKWAWNNEAAQIDFAFRAPHVAGAVGKAIVAAHYRRKPIRSYYQGCSNGGREALRMAQDYPDDFDGIIAGAPSQTIGRLFIHMAWFENVLKAAARNGLDKDRISVLHRAVLAQCDGIDGSRDGLLADPRQCVIDFKKIQCAGRASRDCLTGAQITDVHKLYDGPRGADGRQLALSSVMPGSELDWLPAAAMLNAMSSPQVLPSGGSDAVSIDGPNPAGDSDAIGGYPKEVLRYLAFSPGPGPGFEPRMSDLELYANTVGHMDALLGAMNPDLRPFRDRGGKLLIYWGWNDVLGGTMQGIDYFEAMQRVSGGGARTGSFARMFMIPGMGHCAGGSGPWQVDYLTVLDNWVTSAEPPDSVAGRHPADKDAPEFTRMIPHYRAPTGQGPGRDN